MITEQHRRPISFNYCQILLLTTAGFAITTTINIFLSQHFDFTFSMLRKYKKNLKQQTHPYKG